MSEQRNIVLGVTGSIAAYRAADLIRGLCEKGFKVSVVMTKSAEHFITPLTLSALCGSKVFRSDHFSQEEDGYQMAHIALAQEADAILIAPATANIISKMACGIADDLLTCLYLATQTPVLVAPAMNVNMLNNVVIQENIARLKSRGVVFIDSEEGPLACGMHGDGHIASEQAMINAIEKAVSL